MHDAIIMASQNLVLIMLRAFSLDKFTPQSSPGQCFAGSLNFTAHKPPSFSGQEILFGMTRVYPAY